jgi:hypothetical protein
MKKTFFWAFLLAGVALMTFKILQLRATQQMPTILRTNLPDFTQEPFAWPATSRETHPWSRWWWMGSAVDQANLSRLLSLYKDAGLGGVEICPIYGAKGQEKKFISFLSPEWMEMLAHTTREAKRLDLGIDLTTGTGWPFGGPWVADADASSRVILEHYKLAIGEELKQELPPGELQCLMAFPDQGAPLELTSLVVSRRLNWTAPAGSWRLYAVLKKGPIQQVKRAAPGGEGNVLDPYSVNALNRYLTAFDRAFAGYSGSAPRSQFHDSFEYYGAQWTENLFQEFEKRQGYDLRQWLPALFGEGPTDTVARIKSDYRELLGSLHLAYMRSWAEWCHQQGSLARNQAHGAPANLVDLYAASDIPETEIFGSIEEKQIPLNKFSSSAAHLKVNRLASAESFTWLREHFQTNLSQVKEAADYLFLSGVNHLFLHGIPYSPAEAPWPGWQFYASVNFGPQGGFWKDLPGLNAYVTRVQSVLQSGQPAQDLLLYFPMHDIWQSPSDELLTTLTVHNAEKWLHPYPYYATAMTLWNSGYSFDYLSDGFLAGARCEKNRIIVGGNAFGAILVPKCHFMPPVSLRKLIDLAEAGATVIFEGDLPEDVPGMGQLELRRQEFKQLLQIAHRSTAELNRETANARNQGLFITGADLKCLLQKAGIRREPCVDKGLRFVRREHLGGFHYFIVNRSPQPLDGWVTLGTQAKSAVLFDPRSDDYQGKARLMQNTDGTTAFYLQLGPGESMVLRTFTDRVISGPAWKYFKTASAGQPLTGTWKIQFVEGGPELPKSVVTAKLDSWTRLGGDDARCFAGTARYTLTFKAPTGTPDDWLLDLGRICETARVRLNGHAIAHLWAAPFQLRVGQWLHPGSNTLDVDVTNLAANRIADLDRRKVSWKYFYDANVVGKDYKPLDASGWPLFESGLLGPVKLIPLENTRGGES